MIGANHHVYIYGRESYAYIFSGGWSGAARDAGTVSITASQLLQIINGGEIRASTFSDDKAGDVTIDAGSVYIDGQGSITIQNDFMMIENSLITSSVKSMGDGGKITIQGIDGAGSSNQAMILSEGFIQANAPADSTGGDIFIDADVLIAECGNLNVGGRKRQDFEPDSGWNIIQAAAPCPPFNRSLP